MEAVTDTYTSFDGNRRIATGTLQMNALAVKRARDNGAADPVLTFDDATGHLVDIDTSGSDQQTLALAAAMSRRPRRPRPEDAQGPGGPRGPGRPTPGVVAREVTLLPRHWEWLAGQPGGASVALRKLVQEAQRANAGKDKLRKAQERTYNFMLAVGGDLPGFEEATRALFANDTGKFRDLIAAWPGDLRDHAARLAPGG